MVNIVDFSSHVQHSHPDTYFDHMFVLGFPHQRTHYRMVYQSVHLNCPDARASTIKSRSGSHAIDGKC